MQKKIFRLLLSGIFFMQVTNAAAQNLKPVFDTIYIKTLTGKIIIITTSSDEPISAIKARIKEKEDIPVQVQRLIFAGKQLEDWKTPADYNIKKASVLHLVLRTRGG